MFQVMKRKDFFASFALMLSVTVLACLFHCFGSVYVSSFGGGVFLACVAYFRLSAVHGKGYDTGRHFAALSAGWLASMLPFYALTFGDSLISLMFSLSWGLAVVMAYLCFRFRHWAVCALTAALWLAFVLFAVPAWDVYVRGLH